MRQYVVFDDITQEAGASERQFLAGGFMYSIDLTDEGHDELLELLTPYIKAGRKVARLNNAGNQLVQAGAAAPARDTDTPFTGTSPLKHSEEEVKALRLWCKREKVEVRESGRIKARIWAAFRADSTAGLKPEDFIGGKVPAKAKVQEELQLPASA